MFPFLLALKSSTQALPSKTPPAPCRNANPPLQNPAGPVPQRKPSLQIPTGPMPIGAIIIDETQERKAEVPEVNRQMNLLQILTRAGIRVLSFEVVLIQLPSSPKKREERLQSLLAELRAAGVDVTRPARARSTREFPCDGFVCPASLWLRTGQQAQSMEGVKAACCKGFPRSACTSAGVMRATFA